MVIRFCNADHIRGKQTGITATLSCSLFIKAYLRGFLWELNGWNFCLLFVSLCRNMAEAVNVARHNLPDSTAVLPQAIHSNALLPVFNKTIPKRHWALNKTKQN